MVSVRKAANLIVSLSVRDQKAAENDDISDKNQTLTPSSPMAVEEGAF